MVPMDMEYVRMVRTYILLEIQTGMDSGMLNHPWKWIYGGIWQPNIGKIIILLICQELSYSVHHYVECDHDGDYTSLEGTDPLGHAVESIYSGCLNGCPMDKSWDN